MGSLRFCVLNIEGAHSCRRRVSRSSCALKAIIPRGYSRSYRFALCSKLSYQRFSFRASFLSSQNSHRQDTLCDEEGEQWNRINGSVRAVKTCTSARQASRFQLIYMFYVCKHFKPSCSRESSLTSQHSWRHGTP